MAKTKIIMLRKTLLAAALLAVFGCGSPTPPKSPTITWETYRMDGSRTGVQHLTARNTMETAFGTISDGVYTSPNGRTFKDNEVSRCAAILMDAQSAIASKKKVIGTTAAQMRIEEPQCELSNMYIDALMKRVAALTGKKIDVGLTNFGGIRTELEQGDVMVEDIEAMFPFNNTLVYVPIRGRDLKVVLDSMAVRKWEVVGGIKARVKDKKVVSATIGGAPISDDKVYGVATISFLLNNGDGISLAPLSVGNYIDTHERIDTCMLNYVRALTAAGKKISYQKDDRIVKE